MWSLARWSFRNGLIAAAVMVLFVVASAPPWHLTLIDPDEGHQFLKARLVTGGHALYRDVWCDQVPLHTLALSAWQGWFGQSVAAGRAMTLLLAAMATASLWRLATHGATGASPAVKAAAGGVALWFLLISRHFAEHAQAVMIGPPSLFLAIVALDLVATARLRQTATADLALSLAAGGLLGVAVMFKLLALPAALVIVPLALLDRESILSPRSILRATLVAVVATAVASVVAWRTDMLDYLDQAVGVGARASAEAAGTFVDDGYRSFHTRRVPWIILAAVGVWLGLRRGWRGVWPALSLLIVYEVVLAWHRPFQYHSGLMLTICLSWLGGYGVVGLFEAVRETIAMRHTLLRDKARRDVNRVGSGVLIAAASAAVVALAIADRPPRLDRRLVEALRGDDGPVVADLTIYPFVAGREVVPWLAVLSKKRLDVVEGFDRELVAHADAAGVRQVLLGRMPPKRVGPLTRAWLAVSFRVAYKRNGIRLYERIE